jgi:hypothetical protein
MLSAFIVTVHLLAHPFYVSVTEIEYDREENSLKIVMRVFIDDLEDCLNRSTKRKDLMLIEGRQESQIEEMLHEYFHDNFKVYLNDKGANLKFLGAEGDLQVLKAYFEITGVQNIEKISIYNSSLIDCIDAQENIVHIENDEDIKTLRLNSDNPRGSISWQ